MNLLPFAATDAANLNLIVLYIVIGAVLIAWGYLDYRATRLWHETARLALEKGQPIPEQAQATAQVRNKLDRHRRKHGGNDLRAGLILLGIGSGIYAALPSNGSSLMLFAFVPGGVGVALLLSGIVSAFAGRKDRNSDAASTHS